jgi:hypothetical protein
LSLIACNGAVGIVVNRCTALALAQSRSRPKRMLRVALDSGY